MKHLKLSSSFLILLLSAFTFLTSCDIDFDDCGEPEEEKINLALPTGFAELNADAQVDFFENLNEETSAKLQESYHIQLYLKSIDKLNLIQAKEPVGTIYSDINLENYLSQKEINAMSSFDHSKLESLKCGWTNYNCYNYAWFCGSALRVWYNTCNGTYSAACMPNCNAF